jgi:septal ring factor EnvC (AmiA/AmiB activator)
MRYPVANPSVTNPFGTAHAITGTHTGVDYYAPTGTSLFPIRAGTASWTQTGHPTMGNLIEIDIGGGLFIRYIHLSKIRVSKGSFVDESTVIGEAGYSGYVEPAGPNGAHLHAELYPKINGQPGKYMDIHKYVADNGGGNSSMAETISLDTDRILQHGILGRNGIGTRTQALNGSTGKVFEGQELTNANIQAWFLSEEGRLWRDSWDPSSINDINQKLASISVKDQQIADLSKLNENLAKELTTSNTANAALQTKVDDLTLDNQTLTNDLKAANQEILRLQAELASCGGGSNEDTENLNALGAALKQVQVGLQWLKQRLGIK